MKDKSYIFSVSFQIDQMPEGEGRRRSVEGGRAFIDEWAWHAWQNVTGSSPPQEVAGGEAPT